MTVKKYDIVIVGAGVAGMTAAIYAKRAGKSVMVLDAKTYGGQIIQTFDVANWPGDVSVSGVDLSQKIYHQMNNLGAEFEYAEVVDVIDTDKNGDNEKFLVKTDDEEYACGAIIIATGTTVREMGVEGENKYVGRGISYCATCDGAFYKDKPVIVVGGGNTALYDALYLSDIVSKVYLVHRREEFRGDKILVDKLRMRGNVEFVLPYSPVEIVGEKRVSGLVVRSADGNEKTIEADGIFVAVGRIPATEAFRKLVKLDEAGYVVAGEDCKTSHDGVFVAGDVRTKQVRQLVTAAGDGAVAAEEAVRYLG